MDSNEDKTKNQKRWYDAYKSTRWFEILFSEQRLGLKRDFLEHKREKGKSYKEYVNERLLCADKAMRAIPGEMIAISQLLHTASSVVLLESGRRRVDATLDLIKDTEPFKEIDPTVVVTSVALYFLIRNAEHIYANQKETLESIKHLHTRLDQMNWFLGSVGMKQLDILTFDECYPN